MVNNAGYGQMGGLEEIDALAIEQQFATTLFGTFHVTRAVLSALRRQRAGCIFNLSSVGGMLGFAGASAYCATKFALEGFSESLALEVADLGYPRHHRRSRLLPDRLPRWQLGALRQPPGR